MPGNTDEYHEIVLEGGESQHLSSARVLKVGAALFGGACLVLLSFKALSEPSPTLESPIDLAVMPTSLRASPMTGISAAQLPGPSPWKELAVEAINAANRCEPRDVSMKAVRSKLRNLDSKNMAVWAETVADAENMAKSMPGITPPLGFFDPWGLTTKGGKAFDGTLAFYREAELKHGRTCMLAFLGIIVGEKFHPWSGPAETDILGIPFEETSLTSFYLSIVMTLSAIWEGSQFDRVDKMVVKEDKSILPGDLGFDPLNIKPKKPDEWLAMQNKELLNGRLAMIAFAGIVGQEQFTNTKIFR